jgi:hypothetical protein
VKRTFASVVIVALAALTAPLVGMASAYGAGGNLGNSPNAKLCHQGGWQNWVRADQTPFTSEEDCVSYAAHGGVLTAPSTTPTTGTGVFHGTLTDNQVAKRPVLDQGSCFYPNTTAPEPYNAYTVTLGAPATFTITLQGADSGGGDLLSTSLALYSGTFDPTNPCGANLLSTSNQSGLPASDSKIVLGPEPAGTYTIVAFTTYYQFYAGEGYDIGTYTLTIAAS